MSQKLFIIILLAIFTSACAQQTAFMSSPPGAEVYVDGTSIGTTPCAFDYKLGNGDSHEVMVTKTGFDPVHFVVKTDEVDTDARNRWLAAGVVWSPLWVGTLFTKKFKDSYDFSLRAEPARLTAHSGQAIAPEKM